MKRIGTALLSFALLLLIAAATPQLVTTVLADDAAINGAGYIVGTESSSSQSSTSEEEKRGGGETPGGGTVVVPPPASSRSRRPVTPSSSSSKTSSSSSKALPPSKTTVSQEEPSEVEEIQELYVEVESPAPSWGLINLITALIALLAGVVMLIRTISRRSGNLLRYITIIAGVIPIALFFLLEKFSKMALFSRWSPLIIGVGVVYILALILVFSGRKKNDEEEV